ncbi:addiction module toxin, RelE/StbE family [Ekhidna lutea]|uniref:Addiction module toxin, RelE/StbE family n=1 Tax=Ekhidna lutea TaxID=447679 RepID=A0A239GQ93_EKHLU|nr:type II toxin-antitoxin system RelE/ParE family toxin [Ekhidna lutea]SNS71035.1 addiction module toxin, RelE/StbE family [Ekhidna lutea]
MAEVIWAHGARSDLRQIYDYIAEDSPLYAERFILKLIDKVNVLKEYPNSGRMVPEFENLKLRELIEGNYRIIYKIEPDSKIGIVRVHHSSQLLKNI